MRSRSKLLTALNQNQEKSHNPARPQRKHNLGEKHSMKSVSPIRRNGSASTTFSIKSNSSYDPERADGGATSSSQRGGAALSQIKHKALETTLEFAGIFEGGSRSHDAGDESDIPLSDLTSLGPEDKEDMVPFQRLTINNTSALVNAQRSIALNDLAPFSTHQSLVSARQTNVTDVNDDLSREVAFYRQCLDAATKGRKLLRSEGINFTRPADYFAEMVKSDDHMTLVKTKMVNDAANRKAASEARKLRDLKKFGKQVQISRLQERDKAKRDTLNKIGILKRKRKNADIVNANEDDLFDVALEGPTSEMKKPMVRSSAKAQKDAKFGFGGKKRHGKSGDAISSGDLSRFSVKKMKAQTGSRRLGKSRRGPRK